VAGSTCKRHSLCHPATATPYCVNAGLCIRLLMLLGTVVHCNFLRAFLMVSRKACGRLFFGGRVFSRARTAFSRHSSQCILPGALGFPQRGQRPEAIRLSASLRFDRLFQHSGQSGLYSTLPHRHGLRGLGIYHLPFLFNNNTPCNTEQQFDI